MTEPEDRNDHKPDGQEAVPTADYGEDAVGPGAQIGPYKLISILGEGGYGTIYLAEQRRPVKRRVALKVIKAGMDSKQVLARFEVEQQALALMEHPHIARVYDAGLTPSGRSYFVMEHVKGLPITEHCDKYKLPIEQRLQLFLHVCEAVQHAHQKGIIHRDLKPSNILVVVEDRETIPKVIDFGVARAISQPLTERTLHTEQGQLIGTPEYMSPEQANLTNEDIDTRTDVYSLGVVLYELLTGVLPFDPKTLRTGGIDHIRKVICEEDPRIPSTRVSRGSIEESTESARRRQTDIRTLQRKLHGDLDWITLKAMEKDRTRRYATVDALATDIRHHMNHQPVIAAPPGALYRARKFARRHRQALAVAGAAVVVFLVLLWAARVHVQARKERTHAQAMEHERILDEARDLFEARGVQARGVSDPSSDALALIEPLLTSRHVGAKARLLRAHILAEHGYYDEPVPILKGLTEESPEIAGAAYALLARILLEGPSFGPEELKRADEYRKKAEELLLEEAEAYYLRAATALTVPEKFRLLDRALSLDSDHYPARRLRALTYQASRKYDRLRDDALAMTILKPPDPLGHSLRALALRELGDYDEAVRCYHRAIELTPPEDPQHIALSAQRCETLIWMRQHKQAITDAQACLEMAPDAKVLHFHVFCALTALGQYEKASAQFRHIDDSDSIAPLRSRDWPRKYVFDALDADRAWHPPDTKPEGPAFVPMFEAEEMYRNLRAKKTRRLITDGFKPGWSPDGRQVVFSLGFVGYSGIAIYDLKSREINPLIVPGKDPSWSPDSEHIAFVRDREVLRLSELTAVERGWYHGAMADEEVWVMKADGSEPRRLIRGAGWPSWSADAKYVYCQSRVEPRMLYKISIADRQAQPVPVFDCRDEYPVVSPNDRYVAYDEGKVLQIRDLASQSRVAEWVGPFEVFTGHWSPDGREFAFGGGAHIRNQTGLWIYDMDKREAAKVLSGYLNLGSWSPERTQLLFQIGPPYYEIWVADLDPGLSTVEALGPARNVREHFLERIEGCSRKLAVDPNLFYDHWERAASALWIGDDRASFYLQEMDRAVDRVPRYHARQCYFHALRWSGLPAFRDKLMPLIFRVALKATEEEPGYGRLLAPVFRGIGRQEEAAHVWQMAEASESFLVNGGFEHGDLVRWARWGDLTREVVTELVGAAVPESPLEGKFCLYVDVAAGMANASEAGVLPYGDFVFEAGKKYTISAFLKARKGTLDITFKPQHDVRPWPGYGDEVITITDMWAEYHVTTPVFKEDVSPANFVFHVGVAPGGFWIDDVQFYEGDYVPALAGR